MFQHQKMSMFLFPLKQLLQFEFFEVFSKNSPKHVLQVGDGWVGEGGGLGERVGDLTFVKQPEDSQTTKSIRGAARK